ncbi:hypothetical protein B0H10DRAFT_2067042 [Mycena sp. CBHHK59/15]|nr:hypothetical protein B0H10DRAFT_2067042 [Mycena sp. CBHHK59/15]
MSMDNPQHYQPLSYALHPPNPSTTPKSGATAHNQQREAVEEDDDGEESLVAEPLNPNDHISDSSTGKAAGPADAQPQEHQFLQEPDPGGKRRPGRPRGSKNRRPLPTAAPTAPKPVSASYPKGSGTAPPQLPDVNSQNQQYYEFQWRVLNLCAEFYGAAEELVKGTPPLVVAQCYQMGPGSKVDPLSMLGDAKRICDTLLANPTQLISTPPPPLYPVVPTFYQPQPVASTSAPPKASTSPPKPASAPTAVITNPQSFVVSLGTQPTYPYAGYAPPVGQYPAAYYSPYAAYAPSAHYAAPQPQAQPQPQPAAKPQPPPQESTSALKPTPATSPVLANAGTQGPWSDDEVERLKKLAEDSKATTASGEIEWDWVVREWGNGRTRHQILLKATGLGLKESSGRGNKRRRETDETGTPASPAPPPNPATVNSKISGSSSTPTNTTGSPAMSHTTPTPLASPAMHHLQRPPSTKGHPPAASTPKSATSSSMPWPMPTVAAANVSPVLSPSVQGEQRTSYYRPRPAPTDSANAAAGSAPRTTTTTHQFIYQSSGSDSRMENGKA